MNPKRRPGPRRVPEIDVDFDALCPRVEAALLTSDRAMTAGRLAEALDLPASGPVKTAIDQLNAAYEETGRSFRIEEVAGGYSVMTLPQYADVLLALKRGKNSFAAESGGARNTVDHRLQAAGAAGRHRGHPRGGLRRDPAVTDGTAPGEDHRPRRRNRPPMLYGTTKQFLEVFGLANLKDLPTVENSGVAG